MVGRLSGREFAPTPGDGEGQGSQDVSLHQLRETGKGREARRAAVHGHKEWDTT